jgi:nucleoside-diphosphate-sugar epimerase
MKKVLITGASGFIGRNAIDGFVKEGHEVHCTSRNGNIDPSLKGLGAEWHTADLLADHDLRRLFSELRPTDLLHLAWYAEPGAFWTSEANLDWTSASLLMLRHFADNGGRRAILSGSCVEYDWNYGILNERTTPSSNATLYGACKNGLRTIGESYCDKRGIDLVWGRVFFLYGRHEHPSRLVPSIIRPLLAGREALCTDGEQARDFLNSKDVASAFVALGLSEVTGVVNIGSGSAIKVKELAEQIGRKIGRPDLIKLGALPRRENDPPLVVADVTRLREEVGWRPSWDLDRGLDDAIAWWRKRQDDRMDEPCN